MADRSRLSNGKDGTKSKNAHESLKYCVICLSQTAVPLSDRLVNVLLNGIKHDNSSFLPHSVQ